MVKINDIKNNIEYIGKNVSLKDNQKIYVYGSYKVVGLGERVDDAILIDEFTLSYDYDFTDLYNSIKEIFYYNDFTSYYYSYYNEV